MTKDLTVGNPLKVIVNYMIPVFLGLVLQQAYNLVDTLVVGRFVGSSALGGVGAASSLCLMVMGATMGLCSGFCIPISHAFGEKNETKLRKHLAHAIYLSAANVVLIMTVFLTFGGSILDLMGTLPENYDFAYSYVMVYFMGVPCAVLYNLTSGVMRAMGDSKTPLYFLTISSVCNIILDLLFVAGLRWGVSGAAWATNISQALSGGLCLLYMRKKLPIVRFQKGDMRWNTKNALHLLSHGFPLALQYCVTFVGTTIMQIAINGLKEAVYVNTVAVCGKINSMMNCTFNAIGPTMASFVGQNVGAKRPDRVRSGLLVGILISAVFSAIYILMAIFLTPQMMSLFLDRAKEPNFDAMITYARQYLMTMGAFSILIGLIISHRFTMQGMGFANLAIISGILELCARLLTAYILVPLFGFTGVCFGSPAAWIFASCFVVPGAYICLGRLKRKLYGEDSVCMDKEYGRLYCRVGKHVALSLFTFGIWNMIWVYRTTKHLNKAPNAVRYSPVSRMLLCMFVPYYQIFWFFKHAERLNVISKHRKLDHSDITTSCVLLGVFVPILASVIMQDRINTICTANAAAIEQLENAQGMIE